MCVCAGEEDVYRAAQQGIFVDEVRSAVISAPSFFLFFFFLIRNI